MARTFSGRQRQVLLLLSQGKSNKAIGNALGISDNAVKYHLKNLYRILDVRNRTELALMAIRVLVDDGS